MNSSQELSFEFFPVRTAKGIEKLNAVHAELIKFKPAYCSVTYGAGGSTQDGTYAAVQHMLKDGADAAPHLTCVGASKESIAAMLEAYLEIGVRRFIVLRGDLPSGTIDRGDFKYASDLVSFIRQQYGEELLLQVAAYPDFHPESLSPELDLMNFKRKVDAGANSAVTQYFFNSDSYFAYIDEAIRLGIDMPITPGIMPISNYSVLARFSDACGAEIPRWIRARLQQYQDDEASLRAFGLDVVTHICLDLLENGVEGLHFYTLNNLQPVQELVERVGFNQTGI
jgi:methylenetetrahydrofolate reductase (NADPH)